MKLNIIGALAFLSLVSSAAAQNAQHVTEDTMIKSSDPEIEIFVRNKRPSDMATFRSERTVVFVHGATNPASTGFDFKFGGMSWMDYIAARGYAVYLLDLRGYGKCVWAAGCERRRGRTMDAARRHHP